MTDKAKQVENFIQGMADLYGARLCKSALAFAQLEEALEEMLPAGSPEMREVSRHLEAASLAFGAGLVTHETREVKP